MRMSNSLWNKAHRKECREAEARYRASHREELRIRHRNWRIAHADDLIRQYAIYRERRKETHPDFARTHSISWRKNNSEKVKVERITQKYPLDSTCEFCGSNTNLMRHHPDYDYPYLFVTCCASCHKWVHASSKSIDGETKP